MGTAGSFLSPKQLECASAHICGNRHRAAGKNSPWSRVRSQRPASLYHTGGRGNRCRRGPPGSNKIIAEIPVGVSPHYAIFTPDGKRGLAAVQGPSLLAVFNAE